MSEPTRAVFLSNASQNAQARSQLRAMTVVFPRATSMLIALATVLSGVAFGLDVKYARNFFDPGVEEEFAEAIAKGDLTGIEDLASRGANIKSPGKAGMTFVYWAVLNRSRNGLTYLLGHGAEPNGVVDAKRIPIPGLPEILEGTSPISIAAKLEDPWFLRCLVQHGANINLVNPVSGQTPLVEAIASDRRENMRYLISLGADLNTVDSIGSTPLIMTIGNQRFDVAYELLVAGADPRVPIADNGTTLLAILRHSPIPGPPQSEWRQRVIELLQNQGLDVTNAR